MPLRSRLRLVAVTALALLAMHASPADATTMRSANIVDLIDLAESIVIGEVVSIEDGFDENQLPYSDITIRVVEDITGGRTGLRVIRQFGLQSPREMPNGSTALSTTPPGFPLFVSDEKVVLFIYQASPVTGMQTTVGLTQGKFTVNDRGEISNSIGNVNLFRDVAARTERLSEAQQKLVRVPGGAIDKDLFVDFVRRAVDERWVEQGVLYNEQ